MDIRIEDHLSQCETIGPTLEAYLKELEAGNTLLVGNSVLDLKDYCGRYDGLVALARDLSLLSERLGFHLPRGVSTQRLNRGISKHTKKRCGFRTIYLPWEKYSEAAVLLKRRLHEYPGNEGQIQLAKDAGISHLGALFTAFGHREELAWTYMAGPLSRHTQLDV